MDVQKSTIGFYVYHLREGEVKVTRMYYRKKQ